MTNAELRDLLREARVFVGFCPTTQEGIDRVCEVRDCIDAALAAHRDEGSTEDDVESVEMRWDWHEVNSPNRLEALLMDGTRVECHRADYNGVMGWSWYAMHQFVGFALTLAEAKFAAIAAARGL